MNYLLDSHTHTLASGHAYNTIMEMAREAAEKGLRLLGITEHAPAMPGSCASIYFRNLKVVPRRQYGIEVMLGAELNILNYEGKVDLEPDVMEKLDLNIASLHPPCIRPGTCAQNTAALVRAVENPLIHIIGHPDDGRYPVDYDTLAAAAAEHGVLLEVNNHSLEPGSFRMNARENDLKMLECCMKYGTYIILDSDAHWCAGIGRHDCSLALVEEAGFPEDHIANTSVELYKRFIHGPAASGGGF